MRFQERVAVVTGAGSGIGRATALAFAKEGAAVILVDIDQSLANATESDINESGGRARVVVGDIADPAVSKDAVSLATQTYSGLHYLFNNAGVEFVAPLLETSIEEWDSVMDVNLRGTYLLSKACVEVMDARRVAAHGISFMKGRAHP